MGNCKYSVGGFAEKAALERHKKCGEHPALNGKRGEDASVDLGEEHLCTVSGCRQTRDIKGRGFSRYDNLVAHLRSIHEQEIPKRRGNLPKALRRKREADEGQVEGTRFDYTEFIWGANISIADATDEPSSKIARLE